MAHNTSEPPVTGSLQIPADPLSPNPATGIELRRSDAYLPPGALIDVLFEQIEYLMAHVGACQSDCADCRRLDQVKHWLLLPFESAPRTARM